MAKKKTSQAVVLTARQLLNGYTADDNLRSIWNSAPYQMLSEDEKDDEWRMWNMDWFETLGIRQILKEGRKIKKNYDLANGVLDRSDYMIEDNEFGDMIGMITEETNHPFSLKFYPLVPNIIQVLTGEFAKRDKRIIVTAVDSYAENEALQYKKELLTNILVQDATNKQIEQLKNQGIEVESEEGQKQINAAAQLQEAEVKFKSYRSIPAQWGQHKVNSFESQFKMYELEIEAFKDSLIADREFWEIDIMEDDFKLNLWNPANTFYHKSPNVNYISQGNYVGYIDLMSIPDVIDMYGSKMTPKQVESLKKAQEVAMRVNNIAQYGYEGDSTLYWDATKPYDQQSTMSIHTEQYLGVKNLASEVTNFKWNDLAKLDSLSVADQSMIRVTKVYWRSQRRVGHLTRVLEDGSIIQDIVDEQYKVTCEPIYDNSIIRGKIKENLAYGEHIDWIWINQVWKGIKIGANNANYYKSNGFGFDPIYLDIKPIQFEFKGQDALYGGKLPVEGRIFSERNSTSQSLVDRMKSFQLGYTIVNNQVMDFIADEAGKVVVIDQNMIPKNSLGGSWDKYNFPRFFQVMKDFQIAPVDTSMQNTETPGTSFSHFQSIDLSKTDQIMSRLQLAEFFKNQAFAVVGVTPQRVGQTTSSESATGVQQAVNNSYSQTEMYFEQHANFLMPRVYQMMLEAAQYISATKPQARIAYLDRKEETVWFNIEGWRLLITDFQIEATAKANIKATMEKLQQLAAENNTAGGSLYEYAKIITGDSPTEIITKLKEFDVKREEALQAEREQQITLQREQQAFLEAQREKELTNENYWKERDIQKEILIASMKEGSKPADTSELDAMALQNDRESVIQDRLLKEKEMENTRMIAQRELELKSKELENEEKNMENDLQIAKIQARNKPKPKK